MSKNLSQYEVELLGTKWKLPPLKEGYFWIGKSEKHDSVVRHSLGVVIKEKFGKLKMMSSANLPGYWSADSLNAEHYDSLVKTSATVGDGFFADRVFLSRRRISDRIVSYDLELTGVVIRNDDADEQKALAVAEILMEKKNEDEPLVKIEQDDSFILGFYVCKSQGGHGWNTLVYPNAYKVLDEDILSAVPVDSYAKYVDDVVKSAITLDDAW